MDFCEAAGFEYVPAFNMDETPRGHGRLHRIRQGTCGQRVGPQARRRWSSASPIKLRYLELGNEERVDEHYAAKFEALAKAIWAKDPDVILVVGDFAYGQPIHDPMKFTGAASGITNLAGTGRSSHWPRRTTGRSGSTSTSGPMDQGHPASLEGSADISSMPSRRSPTERSTRSWCSSTIPATMPVRRALGNALATNAIERDGRLPIVTSANCLQPDSRTTTAGIRACYS